MVFEIFYVALLFSTPYNLNAKYSSPRKYRHTNKPSLYEIETERGKISTDGKYKNPNTLPPTNLSRWKIMYINQKDIYLNMLRLRSNEVANQKLSDDRCKAYDTVLDLNLFQLLSLENIRSELQNLEAHRKLSSYVAKAIENNQNPANCKNKAVIGYEVHNICGFGCQIHHLAYAFSVAIGEGKPFVIKETRWHGFNSIYDVIKPLSSSCLYNSAMRDINFIDTSYSYPIEKYVPPVFPSELKEEIEKFHTFPFIWWTGQIMAYLLRPSTEAMDKIKPIVFEHPIVGVHVRRTDKLIWEAKFYSVREYMNAVELYYRKLELKTPVPIRRVYVSSDVPNLIQEFREGYPNYQFITSPVKTSSHRSTPDDTYSIMSDVYHLSRTDYLVCTFSSNVCRLAYELMNSQHIDASENYYSLDNIYHYARQSSISYTLITNHSKNNIHLKPNTLVILKDYDDKRNAKVQVINTNQELYIPFYKLKEVPQTTSFKAFKNFKMDP